jgi:hypothetical protein
MKGEHVEVSLAGQHLCVSDAQMPIVSYQRDAVNYQIPVLPRKY